MLISMQLDTGSLGCLDATCRLLRALNRCSAGPWRALGVAAFRGLELERAGVFEPEEQTELTTGGRKLARVDWKGRFRRFRQEVRQFRAPFSGCEITAVKQPDEVAFCKCRLRPHLLNSNSDGLYIEVVVLENPDNLSMALVDFEAGGKSSVTFSPDTGAVIRETKIRESPRKVEGAYLQVLPTVLTGQRFEGSLGLFVHGGQLSFFRRCVYRTGSICKFPTVGPWECTGYISDLDWAEGRCLTPCLAFRDDGAYKVRLVHVGKEPPVAPRRTATMSTESIWRGLSWEAALPQGPTQGLRALGGEGIVVLYEEEPSEGELAELEE